MYDSAEYANQRLQQTIVTHAGKPFKVGVCAPKGKDIVVQGYYIGSQRPPFIVNLNDLDLTPVKLGFANSNNGLAYLARISLRRDWKQGLRDQNMRSLWGIDSRWVSNEALHNCIVGNYPSLNYALELAENEQCPKAFSRSFAVLVPKGEVFPLIYKYHGKVGTVVNGKVRLSDKWNFLVEALDEALK